MNRPEPNPSIRLSNRIWRGVTLQLFLVAVLPLTVLVLIVTFGSLELHHAAMRSLVADRNLRAVQSAAASIGKEITHRGKILELLSETLGAAQGWKAALSLVETDLAVFEGGVAVTGPDGQTIFTGGPAIQKLAASPAWAQIQRAGQDGPPGAAAYLAAQTVDSQTYIPVIVARPGEITLVGLFSPDAVLSDGLAVISEKEPATILVVDQTHAALFQNGAALSPEEHIAVHPGILSALAGESKIDFSQAAGHGEHVITSSPILPVGWAVMIEESWEDIASPLLRATQNAPLIAIPILGLMLLALWFGLRQIVQPMQALEGKASDLARGNFETIRQPVGGVPEIRHLQETLMDMAGQLKEAQNSLHSYIGAITQSVESERRNLARELHDDTLQSLIALGQYTQYALHWNQDPKVAKPLDQVMELADQGVKNLRRLVQGLRPIYIEDLGLATALSMQADKNGQPQDLEVHFHVEGVERRLMPDVEMALYRITQEALNNAVRHSGARNAWVSLHFQASSVVLEIRDDGTGFELPPDPTYYARLGHYGLLGLHERSELIGAKLTIRSAPGEGTLILVRLQEPAAVDGASA